MATSNPQKQLEDVKTLLKLWHHFYAILSLVFQSEDTIPKEKEREFQQIKTIVAEKHDVLMATIEKDFHVGQNVLNMVKRVISLEEFRKLSRLEVNKLLIEWHDANILLNETLGSLEYRTSDLGKMSESQFSKAMKPTLGQTMGNFFASAWFKRIATATVLVVAVGLAVAYWDVISGTSFYKNYVAKIVTDFQKIFGLQ